MAQYRLLSQSNNNKGSGGASGAIFTKPTPPEEKAKIT